VVEPGRVLGDVPRPAGAVPLWHRPMPLLVGLVSSGRDSRLLEGMPEQLAPIPSSSAV
jgi:hypothetical protein